LEIGDLVLCRYIFLHTVKVKQEHHVASTTKTVVSKQVLILPDMLKSTVLSVSFRLRNCL